MKYFLIVGEASGDLHASNLMRELKIADAEADFRYCGGDLMSAEGGQLVIHYRQMAFMGIVNVLKNARTVLGNLKLCKQQIVDYQPDVIILVDYPSFNLRIAEFAKKNLPKTPVFYYISPKIWAWKEFRIKAIKRYIDKMYTILPFETDFYKKHDFAVEYVGNPSVDAVSNWKQDFYKEKDFCEHYDLPQQPIIAVLAGSRKQEIKNCLPKMVEAASHFTEFQIVVAGAPGIESDFYQKILPQKKYSVIFNNTYELLSHARVAIVNSGTATLETALLNVPQVVVYHVFGGKIANWLKKHVLKVQYVSLVNLIAEKEIVKELVAHDFTTNNVKSQLPQLLFDNNFRKKMQVEYHNIHQKLGTTGAAKRAAEKIVATLQSE
ncbi:MAG: lipid-A-disaccharide synthase [Prevotellaceae bacterium]|jgi:lipid-A-disaccharide synthase|nr:lipid-A-disaccharide synthase [Prevotellaceae bacterium]